MIKFEHTVFALPFAYLGYLLGARGNMNWMDLFWVTCVMVFARTAGMCLNRLIDRGIDAKNPRTKTRALVTGELSVRFTIACTVLCLLLATLATLQLPPLCIRLLPLALLLLTIYHYMKRFTVLCHFGIGAVLACAPIGGWVAATGEWNVGASLLGAAILFWVAGFDIFYSLQDEEYDRTHGLHSLAAKWGSSNALRISQFNHALTLIFLIGLGIMLELQWIYWLGLVAVSTILFLEHHLILKDQRKYLNATFFTMNGSLSIVFLVATTLDLWI